MGEKEEQREDLRPGREREFTEKPCQVYAPGTSRLLLEKFKSALKAQNGMNAELQVDIR